MDGRSVIVFILCNIVYALCAPAAVSADENNTAHFERTCPKNSTKHCVAKCCPIGQSLAEDKTCKPSNLKFELYFWEDEIRQNNYDEDSIKKADSLSETYNFLIGNPCPYGKYKLEPHLDSRDEFHLFQNGSLWVPYTYKDYYLSPQDYCLESFYVEQRREDVVLPLLCFEGPIEESVIDVEFIIYAVGLLISVPFLVATMLVYSLIPELRDLHGKTLFCYVMCLAIAYILLAVVQLGGRDLNDKLCVTVAYLTQFAFLSCFFWLQVMCFDTWWTVRSYVINHEHKRLEEDDEPDGKPLTDSTKNTKEDITDGKHSNGMKGVYCLPVLQLGGHLNSKRTERKVFLFYSLYAWCLPIVLIVTSRVIDLYPTIPSSYIKPNFGLNKCWFSTQEAETYYFYGPVMFVLISNLVLFLFTAQMVWSSSWPQQRGDRGEKHTFRLCFTLFFAMGINWIMEVISWAAGGSNYIWYVTDVVNTLQGVIIFCIFVLEPRVRNIAKKQLLQNVTYLCKCRKSNARTPNINDNHNYSSVSTSNHEANGQAA